MKYEREIAAYRRAFRALPRRFRLVYYLSRDERCFSAKEIALILNLSVEQVKQIERITADMIDYELTFA